jgi:4a-hydroxytetrahydrobiopterin dehydratase
MNRAVLSAEQVGEGLSGLSPDWSGDTEQLTRTVRFPSFLTAVEFISRMAPVAEELDHHPDLRLSWRTVELTLSTHSAGGVTGADFKLAARLDELISSLLSSE